MDYIIKRLEKKIEFYRNREDVGNEKLYLQVQLEYELILTMAYLWNKNIDILSLDKKIDLYKEIITPSIGSIVSIIRKLDINNEIFKAKKVREVINKYPAFRNEKLGHGYSFEDDNIIFGHSEKKTVLYQKGFILNLTMRSVSIIEFLRLFLWMKKKYIYLDVLTRFCWGDLDTISCSKPIL